jgi:hypothetical protein
LKIADGMGADTVAACHARSSQLIAGAARAKFPWLLFLTPDCVLQPGWERDVERVIDPPAGRAAAREAAVFRFELDDMGFAPRASEALTAVGNAIFGLASGEQGLLIKRTFYNEIGGYRPLPLLEDVDIIRRIGRRNVTRLKTPTLTSASQRRAEGYARGAFRHAGCLMAYALNVPLEHVAPRNSRPSAQTADI